MNIDEILTKDSLVFITQIILVTLFIAKRHSKTGERLVIFLYSVIAISYYNYYVKFFHDNNIITAHTAIYKLKLFGPFGIYDLGIFIIFLLFLVKKVITANNYFIATNKLFLYIFQREVILSIISLIGFALFFAEGGKVSILDQIRYYRNIIFGILCFCAVNYLVGRSQNKSFFIKLFTTLALVDLVNTVGQLFESLFVFNNYLWQRGGKDVILINQENLISAVFYLPIIFIKNSFPKWVKIFGLIFIGIIIYDFVKSIYFIIFLYILLGIFLLSRRIVPLFLISFICFLVVFMFFSPFIFSDTAIKDTRAGQLSSYLMESYKFPFSVIFGSGYGGYYNVKKSWEDGGEIKEIDRENINEGIQTQFQVPFFIFYKISGLIGLIVAVFYAILFLRHGMNFCKNNDFAKSFFILAFILMLNGPILFSSLPASLVYFFKLLMAGFCFSVYDNCNVKYKYVKR